MEDIQLDFCLLIPCYNNFEGLILSLKTVIYDPGRFMAVVVDDGSKKPVIASAIKAETKIDYPVIVLRNEKNMGITSALNTGLQWIEENTAAKYIARLDCGDECDPGRFYKQMNYMDKHPETGLLGTWCLFENKKLFFRYYYKTPLDHERIKKAMHFRNVFIHPTVVFKTSLVKKAGNYPYDFAYAEDYAFFWELIKSSPAHILGEFLVRSEINNKGISFKNRQKQLASRARVVAKYGTNPFLRIVGMLRIKALRLIPKQLALRLKTIRGQ